MVFHMCISLSHCCVDEGKTGIATCTQVLTPEKGKSHSSCLVQAVEPMSSVYNVACKFHMLLTPATCDKVFFSAAVCRCYLTLHVWLSRELQLQHLWSGWQFCPLLCNITGHAASEELQMFVSGLLLLLDYLFTKTHPAVQIALKCHGHDLTISTDCRRFLFIYAKREQLR